MRTGSSKKTSVLSDSNKMNESGASAKLRSDEGLVVTERKGEMGRWIHVDRSFDLESPEGLPVCSFELDESEPSWRPGLIGS